MKYICGNILLCGSEHLENYSLSLSLNKWNLKRFKNQIMIFIYCYWIKKKSFYLHAKSLIENRVNGFLCYLSFQHLWWGGVYVFFVRFDKNSLFFQNFGAFPCFFVTFGKNSFCLSKLGNLPSLGSKADAVSAVR